MRCRQIHQNQKHNSSSTWWSNPEPELHDHAHELPGKLQQHLLVVVLELLAKNVRDEKVHWECSHFFSIFATTVSFETSVNILNLIPLAMMFICASVWFVEEQVVAAAVKQRVTRITNLQPGRPDNRGRNLRPPVRNPTPALNHPTGRLTMIQHRVMRKWLQFVMMLNKRYQSHNILWNYMVKPEAIIRKHTVWSTNIYKLWEGLIFFNEVRLKEKMLAVAKLNNIL